MVKVRYKTTALAVIDFTGTWNCTVYTHL